MPAYATIASSLAARFSAANMTAPTGYDAVRVSTHLLPNQLPPTPCVLVFSESGTFQANGGTRLGTHTFTVRFYYDQTGELTRGTAALLAWLEVLTDQLRASTQLGGAVTTARVDSWSIGTLSYAGVDYMGVELGVTVITTEGWAAVA